MRQFFFVADETARSRIRFPIQASRAAEFHRTEPAIGGIGPLYRGACTATNRRVPALSTFFGWFPEHLVGSPSCCRSATMGIGPMFQHDDCKWDAAARQNWRANVSAQKAHWLTLAERGFHPADKLDYSIRQWVIPDHPSCASQSPSAYPIQSDGLLSELQAAIGRYLRAEYDLAQPLPERLVILVREVEQSA